MTVIGETLNPQAFKQFASEVKQTYPQLMRVQFINSGKLQTLVTLTGELLEGVKAIYAQFAQQEVEFATVARNDWDRIDQQRRYKAAVVRNQARRLRFFN